MSFIKSLFFFCCLLSFFDSNAQTKFDLLIGTYTNRGSSSEGIYVYTFDSKTGKLEYKNEVGDIDNPSYLTISPDKKHVYFVAETKGISENLELSLKGVENAKIESARKHFEVISNSEITYDVVDSYDKMIDKLSNNS